MFSEIEARREKVGVQQKELCLRAGVHPTRYTARKNGRSGLSERSLRRLSEALDEIIGERTKTLADLAEPGPEEPGPATEAGTRRSVVVISSRGSEE